MTKFILAAILGLSVSYAQAQSDIAKGSTDEATTAADPDPDAPIVESDHIIFMTLQGGQIKSMNDVQDLFVKALKLPQSYGRNLDALEEVLLDSTNTPKSLEISIIGAGRLKETLGEDQFNTLLDILNNAEENNRDSFGIKNITVFYFE